MGFKHLKAEEVMDIIENKLSSQERWKLLELLYDKHFNIPREPVEIEDDEY
ncbi:hypothetical protein V8Z81_30275 (plasmid) [Priestia megaterium]|uniref:hypothetical protein n=1 Tax=Priestia megaterium TaxID=1404 RepID=UPI0030D3F4D2